jgi:hypothetical protein
MMGLFILFQSLDYSAKKEAHQMISNGAMNVHYSVIKLPASDVPLQKQAFAFVDDDELFWQGTMYDVITKTETSDSVTYYCFKDDGESMLVSSYLKYLDQKNTNRDQQPVTNVLKNLIQAFHLPPAQTNIALTANYFYPEYIFSISFPFDRECLSPPPDTA